jgi:hypothetical protein
MKTTSVPPAGDHYLPLVDLSAYSGLSVRQLRVYLVRPPLPRDAGAPTPPPIPHLRFGRRIVVRQSEFDRWAAAYRVRPTEARALAERLRRIAS